MPDDAKAIRLRGVRVHNLKGVDLDIPTGRLVAFSGVSGSGKSSLAFDTLYAEGQRRYVETFSGATRQFLERLDKPDADRIDGIPPAIAVAQRSGGRRSGRTTVGTASEVHDHLALLFARVGDVVCPNCGAAVEPGDPSAVVRAIEALPDGSRYLVAFPIDLAPDSDRAALAEGLIASGFARVRSADGTIARLDAGPLPPGPIDVVVDRLTRGQDANARRLDSIELAFARGLGRARLIAEGDAAPPPSTFYRRRRCGRCGRDAADPDPRLFRYNSPLGVCPACEGFGQVAGLDADKVVPDRSKSIRSGAIAPWNTPSHADELDRFLDRAPRLGIPVDVPFAELSGDQARIVLEGSTQNNWGGVAGFFDRLESKAYKVGVRVFIARFRGYTECPECGGRRLRPEALAIRVGGLDIAAVSAMTIAGAAGFLAGLIDPVRPDAVAVRIVEQATGRLAALDRIGLGYLTLDRPARTLSSGESRRLTLASALGSGLVNTLYVLDEPSIGLHPRDVGRLVGMLGALRDAGNSVVVVEHEGAILHAADWLVDVGPGAGEAGGRILYEGAPAGVAAVEGSATGRYLGGRLGGDAAGARRSPRGAVVLRGARAHNLAIDEVAFPLGVLCAVTGVSGSGKSTLVEHTLHPALLGVLRPGEAGTGAAGGFDSIDGYQTLGEAVMVDQSPIGRSSRSNPATYLKAFDEIRKAFAEVPEAKARNFAAGKFSFNVEGGRCGTCEGAGELVVDMQFLADVTMRCPECRGTRYRPEVLEVRYRDKSIAEVLELTVREATSFFRTKPKVVAALRPLVDVGLDYLRLGQSASTLSGGEAQRLKLASFLASSPAAMTRSARGPKTLFLLDEPTTGLHPADTAKLLETLTRLLDLGHSLIVVEHAPEILRAADWIVDLGPDAGADGGRVVGQGTPEDVARLDTPTGRALAEILRPSP